MSKYEVVVEKSIKERWRVDADSKREAEEIIDGESENCTDSTSALVSRRVKSYFSEAKLLPAKGD